MAATLQEFYYKISDIRNIANRESAYALDSLEAEEGQSITDRSILGEDEADFFLRLLKIAGGQVYKKIHRYGRGITDAIQFNVNYTPSGGSEAKYAYLQIVDHEKYNINVPNVVDKILGKCLKFYVIREWFAMKDMNDNAVKADLSLKQNIKVLLRESFPLKKVPMVV